MLSARGKVVFVGVLVAAACGAAADLWVSTRATRNAQPTPEERAERAQRAAEFARVLAAANYAKRSMKNPDAFKLEAAQLMPDGAVCMEFRSTNSFGGVVPGRLAVTAKNEPRSDTDSWRKVCGQGGGKDYAYVARALD